MTKIPRADRTSGLKKLANFIDAGAARPMLSIAATILVQDTMRMASSYLPTLVIDW